MRKLSINDFIKRSNFIHNNKYCYSKSIYINRRSTITIICKIHGEFKQVASDHLSGYGCRLCSKCNKLTLNNFILRANKIHNQKYDYSKSVYINSVTPLIIKCKKHGYFSQLPKTHLIGKGCTKCNGGVRGNIRDFIKKANKVHNYKYDYSKSIYINSKSKIEIICKKHNSFMQTANDHLSGAGCTKCITIGPSSKIEQLWLDTMRVPDKNRNLSIKIDNKKYVVDGYDAFTNTIYEFYGDFWHGNPKIFNENHINKINKKTFGELYSKTIKRQKELEAAGFKIIFIWENDFKQQLKNNTSL